MNTVCGARAFCSGSSGKSRATNRPLTKLAYCTVIGLSKPKSLRLPSMTAGVQFFAQVRLAGSTGGAKNTRNVVMLMMKSMTTTEISRLMM